MHKRRRRFERKDLLGSNNTRNAVDCLQKGSSTLLFARKIPEYDIIVFLSIYIYTYMLSIRRSVCELSIHLPRFPQLSLHPCTHAGRASSVFHYFLNVYFSLARFLPSTHFFCFPIIESFVSIRGLTTLGIFHENLFV